MTTPTESTPNPATPTDAPVAAPTNGKRRRILTIVAGVFVVLGILWFALWYTCCRNANTPTMPTSMATRSP